ncbi:MAG: hypothetical protein PHU23_01215 [Dehalococcoidales bacterium]|nr:hypothetical protein [Dehalococcoidales bacterium]
MSKEIMTLEAYREMGQTLQKIRNVLVEKSVELDRKYGKSKGIGIKLERAVKRIDKIRSQLDDSLFNEYPDLKIEEGCKYYY